MTRRDSVYTALLAVFPLVVFFPMFFSDKIMSWLDMMFYFLPFRELTSGLIRQGVMPFWNPLIYCGNPLMANMQSAVFYPLNIFYHVLPADTAVRVTTYIVYAIMAIFTYSFFRLYGTSEEGSFTGAVLFAFGFYTAIKAVEMAEINVMAWIPAALYFMKKYSLSGKSQDKYLAAMALALSLLGGHPQFFVYGYMLFSAFFFYEMVYHKKGDRMDGVKDFAFINTILLLVTLIQLVPTARFVLLSKRALGGLSVEENMMGYMGIEHFVSFFFPFMSGYFSKHSSFLNWMGLIDIGVLPLLLFIFALWKMRDAKLKVLLASLLIFSAFFAFLGSMPGYKWLFSHLPILSATRYQSKIIFIALFAVCFLAAKGFDLLFSADEKESKSFAAGSIISGAIILLIYLACDIFKDQLVKMYRDIFDPRMTFAALYDNVELYRSFLSGFLIYTVVYCTSVLVIYLAAAKQYRSTLMKSISVVLIAAGIFIFNSRSHNVYAPYQLLKSQTKQTQFLARNLTQNQRLLAPAVANPFEHDVSYGSLNDVFYYNIDSLVPNIPMSRGFKNADGFDSLFLGDFARLKYRLGSMASPWDSPAFKLLSVRYISSLSEIKGPGLKLASKSYTYIYENSNCLDQAFFIPESAGVHYAAGKEAMDILFSRDFDPGKSIILDLVDMSAEVKKHAASGRAIVTSFMPDVNSIRVSAETAEPGYIVVTDNDYPGWSVYVDGNRGKVIKAYGTFKSVYVGAGRHEILFRYRPDEFMPAALISILVLMLLIPAIPVLLMLF